MPETIHNRVKEAQRSRQLIRMTRQFESASSLGYVLDVSDQWFLLSLVSDEIHFNGFECLRIADLDTLDVPAPTIEFVQTALKKRGEQAPTSPQLDLSSVFDLLTTSGQQFPLVTIHQETVDLEVCRIGKIMDVTETTVRLLEIDTNAKWDEHPSTYDLQLITRVDLGQDYEEALSLVAGTP